MNKSISAAITAMLLITSSAWATSPEGQAVLPTGDNRPDSSPTEQANEQGEQDAGEARGGNQDDDEARRHSREDNDDRHRGEDGDDRGHDHEHRNAE